MLFELWARDRETMQYHKLDEFYDEEMKYYKADCVDPELYVEVLVLRREPGKDPAAVMYKELTRQDGMSRGKTR